MASRKIPTRSPERNRIVILKVFFAGFAALIFVRTIQLQLARSPRLARLADRQFKTRITALPRRGFIFDRNGQSLAISLKVHSLYVRPEVLQSQARRSKINNLAVALSRLLRMPLPKIREKLFSKKSFVWVKRQLGDREERLIRDLDIESLNDGLGLAEESKRFYPNRELAAHAVGTVNVDGRGIEGLELYYDAILSGERTRIASIKDAMGRSIFKDDQGILAFKDGQSIQLTIDKTIQYESEKILKAAIQDYGARAGTAIVASVKTGEVLAMANYPTYDPNTPKEASLESRRNRAITDIYEPGSTFKPILVGMALEKGLSPKTQIYCEKGKFKVGDRVISEAESHEQYEWLSLGEILKFSSNIGAAKLALNLGSEYVGQWFERIPLGAKTGIDLPGEVSGIATSRHDLIKDLSSQVRLANVGFGHGVTVTPLQILSYYLTLANGGSWVQPKMVRAVVSEDGEIRHRFDETNARKIFTPEVARVVSSMLEEVVKEKGTGVQAALQEWPVAGKTGTAQKIDPATHRYSKNKYIASFAGFAPAKSPELVTLVVIDEPTKKYYSGDTAAPTFRQIMQASLMRIGVPAAADGADHVQMANTLSIKSIEQEITPPRGTAQDSEQTEINEKMQFRLPSLKGLTIREALKTVSKQTFDVQVIGSGILKEQVPSPNEWLEPGSKVKLIFSPEP